MATPCPFLARRGLFPLHLWTENVSRKPGNVKDFHLHYLYVHVVAVLFLVVGENQIKLSM